MVRVNELEWDEANEEHVARHGVEPDEVEDVCFGRHWAIRSGGRKRLAVFGQAGGGRYILVIVERLGRGRYRPITARDMDHGEKRNYRLMRGRHGS